MDVWLDDDDDEGVAAFDIGRMDTTEELSIKRA